MTAILLSGALGALLATIANAVFQVWKEQKRLKADVFLSFVTWYERCLNLINRVIRYAGMKNDQSVGEDDRSYFARKFLDCALEFSDLVHSQEQPARFAIVCGQGEEVKLVETLIQHFEECGDVLVSGGNDPSTEKHVAKISETKLTPVYKQLVGKMLRQASMKMLIDEAWHGK